MKRSIFYTFFIVLIYSGVVAYAEEPMKRFGLGISVNSSSHLPYPDILPNMITYKLIIYPVSRISIEPLLAYREYDDKVNRVEFPNLYRKIFTYNRIQAFGVTICYHIPLQHFDFGIRGTYRNDNIDADRMHEESYNDNDETNTHMGSFNRYDIDSIHASIGVGRSLFNLLRIEFEGGYRISNESWDSSKIGVIESRSHGWRYGISVEAFLF